MTPAEPGPSELAASVLESLERCSLSESEVLLKQGRSRRCEIGPQGQVMSSSQEQGWAVRATNSRSSLFVSGSGRPSPDIEWPEPDGQSLPLPPAQEVEEWQTPQDLDASLMSESESIGLLEGIERELVRELPGARLLKGLLEEGTSETDIFSSSGIRGGFRSRAASLHLQAVGPWSGSSATMILLAEREVRRFQPLAAAKCLANRLLLQHQGSTPSRERGEMLIGPAVAVRLLAGLSPLLIGSSAPQAAKSYRDRQGHIGSQLLTVIDNGRLPGGVFEAPVDGEGLPTREVVLIEHGTYRQALVGWERARADASRSTATRLTGNRRRDSWRDLPRLGPSHLYLKPQTDVSVASLLGSIARGQYLIEPVGTGLFDFQADRFHLPVCGFEVQQGQATAPLSRVWIEGSIGSLLRGIQAVARDLSFEPLGGMIGSPTILVTGLGIRG